jgi:hypothetical protein
VPDVRRRLRRAAGGGAWRARARGADVCAAEVIYILLLLRETSSTHALGARRSEKTGWYSMFTTQQSLLMLYF